MSSIVVFTSNSVTSNSGCVKNCISFDNDKGSVNDFLKALELMVRAVFFEISIYNKI